MFRHFTVFLSSVKHQHDSSTAAGDWLTLWGGKKVVSGNITVQGQDYYVGVYIILF